MLDKPTESDRGSDQLRPLAFAIPTWPIGIWGPGPASAPNWSNMVFESFATLGNEWADFVGRRVKEDLNLLPRLAACRSPEQISNVYVTFWCKLGEDYSREFAVLSKLTSDSATSAITTSTQKPQG